MKPETPTVMQPPGFPGLPSNWETEWLTLPGVDAKTQLFVWVHRKKEVERRPARVLFVIHGFGEHGGRYLHFPHYLEKSIDVCVALDLRGHGRSEGIRGYAENFEQLVEDVETVLPRVVSRETQRYGKIELHLFGHSMGGHILLRLLRRLKGVPVASASVSAPFLGIHGPVPLVKKTAARLLSNVWGSLQLATNLDAKTISRDDGVVKTYVADRLVHDLMTPRLFTTMTAAMKDTLLRDEAFEVPLQFQIPLQDRLVDSSKSLDLFKRLQGVSKQLKTYPDSFHEAMNDLDKESFFEDLRSWIEAHSSA